METTSALVAAGILRAAFIIFGFALGIIIVQKPNATTSQQVFGTLLMVVFLIIWLAMAFF